MAFPNLRSGAATYSSGSGTSISPTMPAATQAGDTTVLIVASDGATSLSTPAGWTKLLDQQNGANFRLAVYAIEGGGIVTPTITGGASGAWFAWAWAFGDTGKLVHALAAAGAAATSVNANPPNSNPAVARDYTWLCAAMKAGNSITTAPTNYTLETGGTRAAAARRDLNASSEDPGTFGGANSQVYVAATVAVWAEDVALSSYLLMFD